MATPTPPAGSKRPAGSVSTPSHLNQLSPPRSVPSPVTARHPAGKTPVSHPTGSSSQGSKTHSSTPMVQNLSQTGNTSSPSANMLSFGTPNALGIEGVTPAGLNIPTPALGGASMMPTMSEMGFTTSVGKRNEDEERRAKMRKVLKSIGKPKGRVSEEGIARVSRRVGFANDIDAEKLTPEEKERKVGNRPISTAGNTIVIEVDMKNHVPQNVQVMYSVQSKALEEQGAKAGQVLLDDLKAPDGIALNAKLDRFALNLERLARMDRLSSNGVNCFEALSGLYSSLHRLYEQEMQAAKSYFDVRKPHVEENADMEVMCKKSGKPQMHAHGKLGLEIAYWQESRLVSGLGEVKPDGTAMDIDGQENHEVSTALREDDQVFALRIEAEASSGGLYPSLRVSEEWLPDPLLLNSADSAEGAIPWQDPPPTLVAADAGGGAMVIDGQQKLPDLRFVAKLDPPLIMPYQTAVNVLTAVGVHAMITPSQQYAALLLDISGRGHGQHQTASFTTNAEQMILSHRDGEETIVTHIYTLVNAKLDWGYRIEELPFSHLRQLVELLPTLRQWACVGSLLRATFNSNAQDSKEHAAADSNGAADGITNGQSTLGALLEVSKTTDCHDGIPVNIALATAPTPTLIAGFPTILYEQDANITVQVLPNADFIVTNCEGVPSAVAQQTLAKALDACGDLGVWVEWLRTRSA